MLKNMGKRKKILVNNNNNKLGQLLIKIINEN